MDTQLRLSACRIDMQTAKSRGRGAEQWWPQRRARGVAARWPRGAEARSGPVWGLGAGWAAAETLPADTPTLSAGR